ncbi:MAG: hypothetical protein WB587_04950, partial [Nitrososphaeraceae archaeon]
MAIAKTLQIWQFNNNTESIDRSSQKIIKNAHVVKKSQWRLVTRQRFSVGFSSYCYCHNIESS